MIQGLERLFWLVGAILVAPFLVQQSLTLGHSRPAESEAAQLRSLYAAEPIPTRPAIASSTSAAFDSTNARGHDTTKTMSLDEVDTELWSPSRIAALGELLNMVERPVGALLIPSLSVEVPVFAGTSEAALTLGAGIIPGTADLGTKGNTGLASHRDGHFRHLKNVAVGDLLLVKTSRSLRQYQITETHIVEPSDTWVLEPSTEPSITLVTCYPFHMVGSAPQRYIVSAREVWIESGSVQLSDRVQGGRHDTLEF